MPDFSAADWANAEDENATRAVVANNRSFFMVKPFVAMDDARALSGPELRLLGSTARFEDLVEHLDLPSQSIPVELLNGVLARLNRQIGDQLPIDFLSVLRCPALLGMDHG